MSEKVNHPKHYNNHPSGIECIEIVRHMNFNQGNAVKYIWRAGLKEGESALDDLKKAVFYLEDEIKRLGGDGEDSSSSIFNPDWDEAPGWAQWWAMDRNGEAYWYLQEPVADNESIWRSKEPNSSFRFWLDSEGSSSEREILNWHHSLRSRSGT